MKLIKTIYFPKDNTPYEGHTFSDTYDLRIKVLSEGDRKEASTYTLQLQCDFKQRPTGEEILMLHCTKITFTVGIKQRTAKPNDFLRQYHLLVEPKLNSTPEEGKWYDVGIAQLGEGFNKFILPQRGQSVECKVELNIGVMVFPDIINYDSYVLDLTDHPEYVQNESIHPISVGFNFNTEKIEDSIRNPVAVYPNNNTVDVSKPVRYFFQFCGERLNAYSISFYDSETDELIYEKPFSALPKTYYNGEFVYIDLNLAELTFSLDKKITNGKSYYYKIKMSKYTYDWGAQPNFETVAYYFEAQAEPSINFTVPSSINTKEISVTAYYVGTVPMKCYQFELRDGRGKIIDKTDKIFSYNINYKYSNLLYTNTYSLTLTIDNQNNQTFTRRADFSVSYGSAAPKINFKLSLEETNNSVIISLSQQQILQLKEVKINGQPIEKLEVSRIQGNNTYSETISTVNIRNLSLNPMANGYDFIDYSARNNQEYTYAIYPITANFIGTPSKAKIITDWDGYCIYPLTQQKGMFNFKRNNFGNIETWKFLLNAEEGSINFIQDKTIFTTFAEKPKISLGDLNYREGSLKCLLGNIICGTDEENYYEPNKIMDSWEDFIKYNSICLFKNPKGDRMIVLIKDSSKSYMNEVANIYQNYSWEENHITNRPSVISFSYVEIAELNRLNNNS